MKQYEIPCNFDNDYVGALCERMSLFPYIKFVYVAAWKDDGDNTRHSTIFAPGYPATYEEYVMRIKLIQALGLSVCILAQKNFTMDTIEKYYDLGIRYFIIFEKESVNTLEASGEILSSDLIQTHYCEHRLKTA